MEIDIEQTLADLRADDGPELTSADGDIDWVVVERVLAGHPIKMTRGEWDAVAGRLIALRLEHHGVQTPKSGNGHDLSGTTSPYRVAVARLAVTLGMEEADTIALLQNWWETWRRRELRALRRLEEMRGKR